MVRIRMRKPWNAGGPGKDDEPVPSRAPAMNRTAEEMHRHSSGTRPAIRPPEHGVHAPPPAPKPARLPTAASEHVIALSDEDIDDDVPTLPDVDVEDFVEPQAAAPSDPEPSTDAPAALVTLAPTAASTAPPRAPGGARWRALVAVAIAAS